jgi:hypothetical protein
MAPDELGGDADAAGVGTVGRAELDPPVLHAVTLVPPDGFRPAVPDGEADAVATTSPCVCDGALQLSNVQPTRIAPTESRRTWNSPRTSALVNLLACSNGNAREPLRRFGATVRPVSEGSSPASASTGTRSCGGV